MSEHDSPRWLRVQKPSSTPHATYAPGRYQITDDPSAGGKTVTPDDAARLVGGKRAIYED